ncbi:MAG: hypothetical protein H7343_19410 [Undibacterium sp.]|nr:hypothetical protein [Opitutaceae bacterium]
MNRRIFIPSTLILVVVVGVALFQSNRELAHRSDHLNRLRQQTLTTEQALAAQRRTLSTLAHDLSAAESQLATLPLYSPPAAGTAANSHSPEIAAWLANVKRLKQLFADRPERRISEMRLLTDEDWLRATHGIRLNDEESIRRTLAAIRTAAVSRFKTPLVQAFATYAKTANRTTPASASALAPFFANPADAESLNRYEIVATNLPENLKALGAATWSLLERSAIDEDYDTRHRFNPDGGGNSASGIAAWNPDLKERTQRAAQAFTAANPAIGSPVVSQLLPYFNPPLSPAIAEKLITTERSRQR